MLAWRIIFSYFKGFWIGYIYAIKKGSKDNPTAIFFNIAFAVALEEVEEWVCVCRKAAPRSSAEAIDLGSPDRCRKETTAFAAAPPQVLPKVPPPAAQRLY